MLLSDLSWPESQDHSYICRKAIRYEKEKRERGREGGGGSVLEGEDGHRLNSEL